MRSGSRCPAFYGEIPPMRWGILNDDGGYFYCITYTHLCDLVKKGLLSLSVAAREAGMTEEAFKKIAML